MPAFSHKSPSFVVNSFGRKSLPPPSLFGNKYFIGGTNRILDDTPVDVPKPTSGLEIRRHHHG